MIKYLTRFIFLMTIVLIASIWLFAREPIRAAAPYVIWSLAAVVILAGAIWLVSFALRQFDQARMSRLETDRAARHGEFEHAAMAAALGQMRQNLIYPRQLNDVAFTHYPQAKIEPVMNGAVPLIEAPPMELLDYIGDLPNILVVGGKGSGKTTLLQHLESMRLAQGKTIILDSHSQPGQWQGTVIGCGREYALIKNAMVGIVAKLDERYKSYATGHSAFEPIHTFIDEFTMLPRKLKDIGYDVQSYSIPVLTEGRKVSVNAIWGIHSDRAAALGLEGAADLKECFDCIVYLKHSEYGRYALINFGEGVNKDQRFKLPGPFAKSARRALPESPPLQWIAPDLPESPPAPDKPTDEETEIIKDFILLRDSAEFSWRKATQQAFGEGKFGQTYNDKLKAILDRFGVDYSE